MEKMPDVLITYKVKSGSFISEEYKFKDVAVDTAKGFVMKPPDTSTVFMIKRCPKSGELLSADVLTKFYFNKELGRAVEK